ncbi:prepilin-type N-terminal cleavage/methylation domain-containing protein [Ferrimonas sediminicola]|uniref:Prepilin-type N-terminal cleavage/methylation domain-containing protein n=1 Tax=Ferrimonas sediminicola TaxID=2569538 RepID=A0A4U1BCN1_9GAMM|nr:type IV pilin protein [Ferrimonas sediminicola]TKB48783.1 prepilin-type N-terminal cleavage/methylation domain-containing protein [Ferrimonas sediminicola]
MRVQGGVSLIELMLVVAILGLLLTLALPSYQGHLASGYRSDAIANLMKLANLQERYYLSYQSYTDDMTRLGLAADPWVIDGGRYALDAESAGADSFLLKATALGSQAASDPGCASITLSDQGARAPAECWQ